MCTGVHILNMLIQSQSTSQERLKDTTYEHGHPGTPPSVHLLSLSKVAFRLFQSLTPAFSTALSHVHTSPSTSTSSRTWSQRSSLTSCWQTSGKTMPVFMSWIWRIIIVYLCNIEYFLHFYLFHCFLCYCLGLWLYCSLPKCSWIDTGTAQENKIVVIDGLDLGGSQLFFYWLVDSAEDLDLKGKYIKSTDEISSSSCREWRCMTGMYSTLLFLFGHSQEACVVWDHSFYETYRYWRSAIPHIIYT